MSLQLDAAAGLLSTFSRFLTPSILPCHLYARRDLSNYGLDGYLPPELLQISTLKSLNLSNNYFHGSLPPQWASTTLETLDLANNVLSGPLPTAYGDHQTFPALSMLNLQGNLLSGPLPIPEWTTGFAPQAVLTLRPGNDGLCGPVPIVDPTLFAGSVAATTSPAPEAMAYLNSMAAPVGSTRNVSQVYIMHEGILGWDTSVVVTNTLGSCAEPCGQAFTVATNLLDATWQYNVSLADLMANNPGLSPAEIKPGTQLALPCYPDGVGSPQWFGSDVGVGMFAGGNEHGINGVIEAELAGQVVSYNGLGNGVYYDGAYDTVLPEEPVYWFVKMDATFTVSAVSITAGNAMHGVSLYVGNNATDFDSNVEVWSNLSFLPGETKVLPVDHLLGKLVVLDTGTPDQGAMSLANTKVWPAEGNAALNKPISSAGPLPPKANFTTDGSLSTCVTYRAVDSDSVWLGVDLGYDADVAVVALTLGHEGDPTITDPSPTFVQVYVSSDESQDSLSNATACAAPYPDRTPNRDHHVVVACGRRGRYVGVQMVGVSSVGVCELEVFLESAPVMPSTMVDSKSVVGIAVGAALGGAALALLIVAAAVYLRRRRRQRVASNANGNATNNGGGVIKGSMIAMTPQNGSGQLSDPDALEAGKGVRHDSITSGAGSANAGLIRKWVGLSWAGSAESGRSSPSKITSGSDAMQPSTDLSKFTDGCDIVDFREIELVRTIGEGSFGLVWMARYLQTTVAVKILTHDLKREVGIDAVGSAQPQPSEAVMAALQREASIMAGLRHPNCIQYLGATLNPPALIMEYCSKRSVDTILAAATLDAKLAKQLDWFHLLSMACDAAKGMLYLHTRSPPIVHRDLKSPNLLVDGLWHVKVSDFNLSRAMENNAVVSSLQITNPRWLAPEVLKGGQAGTAADVYSFGVVLWELLTWRLPWGHDTNPFAIINSVGGGGDVEHPAPR